MKRYSMIRQFNKRLVVSGNILEYYEYEKPCTKGFEKMRAGRANALFTSEEVKQDNRKKTAQRARSTVRRCVNANPQLNKFFTLTFADNVTDLDFAHYAFDKFVKRLKTRFKGFQYISVQVITANLRVNDGINLTASIASKFHLFLGLPR